jgi:hypothetical protein
LAVQKKLILPDGYFVVINYVNRLYKVRIGGFSTRAEAELFLPEMIKKGHPDAFVIRNQNPLLP